MICPKCGRPVKEHAVICRGCDFILDTGFLGGDILDEEHQLRPGQGGVDPAVFNLADAVILGNIGDDSSSFETSDSGFHLRNELQGARLYVSGRSHAVMSPDAVIGRIESQDKVRLTPFEKHVLRFIDGRRPVETIRRQAGLDEAEVKTALANLADKGVVKVVGRALADVADGDVDTAPGLANKKVQPRRMRGTLVGAVVVVGDAADQAIDDAFRTQILSDAPRVDPGEDLPDESGVFSSANEAVPARSGDFDNLASFEERGTVEVVPDAAHQATVAKNALGGFSQKDAFNRQRDAKNNRTTTPKGDLVSADASDGFDDFGDPSNLATAVVTAPSLSDESIPAAVQPGVTSGVFADRQPASNLSDLDDFFDPHGVDDIADSRVEARPPYLPIRLPPTPLRPAPLPPAPLPPAPLPPAPLPPARVAPPALPSASQSSQPSLAVGLSLGESLDVDEHTDAATVHRNKKQNAAAVWAAKASSPALVKNAKRRLDLSTSLSSLLGESFEEPVQPTLDHHPDPASLKYPNPIDSAEEPTAFRAPPAPMMPFVARPPNGLRVTPALADSPSTMAPVQAEEQGDDEWSDATEAVEAPAPPVVSSTISAQPSAPSRPTPQPQVAEEIQEAPDLFEVKTDGQRIRGPSSVFTSGAHPADGARPAAPIANPRPSMAALPRIQPAASGHPSRQQQPPPPPLQPNTSLRSSHPNGGIAPQSPPAPSPTLHPGRIADAGRRMPDDDLTAVPSYESEPGGDSATNDRLMGHVSSAEILDSAMVIRPSARAARSAGGPNSLRLQEPLSVATDDYDFMVDPDATMNLPARPKSLESMPRPNPSTSGLASESEGAAEVDLDLGANTRRPPTEDMKRKARQLFEQAKKDYDAGKLGAARMNAKLSTIYDPDNEEFRRIVEAWEDKPQSGNSGGSASRPEYVLLYEQAQDLENENDIDGALELLYRGVLLAPHAAAFHNRIGVILAMRKSEFDRAAAEIQKAIALEPDNPHYRNNLGKVMKKGTRRKDSLNAQ